MSIIPENAYSHSAIKQKGWILRRKRFGKKIQKMVDRERGLGQGMQMLRLRVENNLQLLCRHCDSTVTVF